MPLPTLPYSRALLAALILLSILLSPAHATNSADLCSSNLNYSPFTPWFTAWPNVTSGPEAGANVNNMACWWYADCCFSLAPSTRQQQFAATALVMGLLPLILKDIAWPQQRIAWVSHQQSFGIEVLVRALGLNPIVDARHVKKGRTFRKATSGALLLVLVVQLVLALGALVAIELFSKRSSLGCPVPMWVVLWLIAAFIPATIEVGASRYQRRSVSAGAEDKSEASLGRTEEGNLMENDVVEKVDFTTAVESVPGGEQGWFVQFAWAIYYAAGTLIFTSIMLVTVIELFVWLLAAGAATAASKMLGYKLCGHWGTK